jgi:alpha-acetolactate decarboxylase
MPRKDPSTRSISRRLINALLEGVYDGDMSYGQLAIDDTSDFHLELPTDGAFLAAELGGDRTAEVKKAEK